VWCFSPSPPLKMNFLYLFFIYSTILCRLYSFWVQSTTKVVFFNRSSDYPLPEYLQLISISAWRLPHRYHTLFRTAFCMRQSLMISQNPDKIHMSCRLMASATLFSNYSISLYMQYFNHTFVFYFAYYKSPLYSQ